MANELQFYNAAKAALSKAVQVDEVKQIHNKAAAIKAAAKVAKDKNLEADAHEIRMRAERRLDQLIKEQEKTVGLNKGGRPSTKTGIPENPVSEPGTLAEAGIDKNLAQRARNAGKPSDEEFEQQVEAEKEQIKSPTKPTPIYWQKRVHPDVAYEAARRGVTARTVIEGNSAGDSKQPRDATEQPIPVTSEFLRKHDEVVALNKRLEARIDELTMMLDEERQTHGNTRQLYHNAVDIRGGGPMPFEDYAAVRLVAHPDCLARMKITDAEMVAQFNNAAIILNKYAKLLVRKYDHSKLEPEPVRESATLDDLDRMKRFTKKQRATKRAKKRRRARPVARSKSNSVLNASARHDS